MTTRRPPACHRDRPLDQRIITGHQRSSRFPRPPSKPDPLPNPVQR